MHGRKKSTEPRSEAEIKTLDRKTELYSKTLYIVLERKKCGDFTEEALELTAKMLKSNPDFYSVWNYRKEILVAMIPDLAISVDTDHNRIVNDEVRVRELKLSEDCIRKNPKSCKHNNQHIFKFKCPPRVAIASSHLFSFYFILNVLDGAWHHRQWILERIQVDFYSELELCKLFLMEDQRNFHCWCYRRLVVNIGDIKPTDEFAFSGEKIDENFSNYSAFHHRSVYIQKLGKNASDMVEAEFSIIENAIYTEPDDQSAWWYHQFLLTWISQQQQQQQQGVQQSNNSDDVTSSSSSSGTYDELK